MLNLKRIIILGTIILGGVSYSKQTIVMIPKVIGSPYFDIAAEGAIEAGKDLDIEVIYNGPTTGDAAKQVNIIQDMMNKNVDAIIISPNDANAVQPALKRAMKRGIKVITYDGDTNKDDSRDIFVNQVSAEQLGRHLMDNVAKGIGEKGDFAIVTASLTAANQNTWIKWMKDQQKEKYPNVNLVTIVPSEEDQQKAFIQTQNLLKAYPNLKAIAAISTVAQPGAAQAIEQLGMAGKVKLYGLATPNGMRQYIKSGIAESTTLWEPKKLGYLSVVVAKKIIENKIPANNEEINKVGKINYTPESTTVIMGNPVDFTIENIDNFDF
ncbi:MAG: autoinducer 2 ABC transporter substrate-binding protein [Cetobacterium sp.]